MASCNDTTSLETDKISKAILCGTNSSKLLKKINEAFDTVLRFPQVIKKMLTQFLHQLLFDKPCFRSLYRRVHIPQQEIAWYQ